VPSDPFAVSGADQPPYYVLADPPTGTSQQPQFQLTTPMVVPGGSNNLAAYMSVDSDYGPNYGKITVLRVPTQSNIQGPSQVANVFKSKPDISKDISLLGSGQSEVLHGNLLTLPLGDSFLYVEPLYVQATNGSSSYPTLQRVLVTYGDKIGYGATLSDALDDIRLGRTTGTSLTLGQTTGNGGTGSSSTPPPTTTPASPTTGTSTAPTGGSTAPPKTEKEIRTQLATVQAALKAATGDQPLKIAQLQQQQQALIQQLLALQSVSPTPKQSASPTK
jgi:uncharacterized membrane protein (UPF0182 family)